jgi:hypothetical protein
MDFILIEFINRDSAIIPTRLITMIMPVNKYNDQGMPIPHQHCHIWQIGSEQPIIVNHTISALRDKLNAG